MEDGYLAFYESLVITRLVWQAERPGYVRFRRPPGSVVVVRAPFLGGERRSAGLCLTQMSCVTVRYAL